MTDAHALTVEEMRRLDADYRPIEPFDEWAALAPPAPMWDRYVQRYEAVRAEASPDVLAGALADVTRAAAFDTGAIEGLYAGDRGITHTVMTQAATWEAYVAQERGWDVVDFVKAHVEAFDMALDLATGGQPITEAWIRRVHEVVCAPQEAYEVTTPVGPQRHALPKGEYKRQPNHVLQPDGTPFAYAPVDDVGREMARLVAEVRRTVFGAAHPTTQAAYLHHTFVRIHPFSDGNGRVARILASVPLLRALSVPLVVYADQRASYLDALRSTDEGDRLSLSTFVVDRVLDTIDLVTNGLRSAEPNRTGQVGDRRPLPNTVERNDVAYVGMRLQMLLANEWQRQATARAESVDATAAYSVEFGGGGNLPAPDVAAPWTPEYAARLHVELQITGKDGAFVEDTLAVRAAPSAGDPFALRATTLLSESPLEVRVSDMSPEVTRALRLRASAWIARLVGVQFDDLRRQAG